VKGVAVANVVGLVVAVLIGALLGLTVGLATVASQKPDAKQENMQVSSDVTQAGGDVSRVVLRYGSR
jgi:hypothetical protein